MDPRQARGLQIAKGKRVKSLHGIWIVPSQSHDGTYVVDARSGTCTCPDHETRGVACKHIWAVEYARHRVAMPDGGTVVTETMKVTYSQNWVAYNAAQCGEKGRFETLLRALCERVPQPQQKTGRPRLALSDVIYSAAMKVYSTVSGRRATTDIERCEEKGLIEHAPHYNSIFRYMDDDSITPILKSLVEQSATPLRAIENDFAIDGTGFTTTSYVRWYDHKYGKEMKAHRWVKAHAVVGVKTGIVTSAEVTEGDQNDCPMLPDLVKSTAKNFKMRELSADKGYLSFENYKAVQATGATPYIMFKGNSVGEESEGPDIWKQMYHLFSLNRPTYLNHYHKRSNVESVFSAVKRKFGPSVRAKSPIAQYNEVWLKLLAHNVVTVVHSIHELGIDPSFWSQATGVAS